jgi:uncharacterized MnhB-related membrane protein
MNWLMMVLKFIIVMLCLSYGSFSKAHTPSQSFSKWVIDNNRAEVSITVLSREITRLALDDGANVSLTLDKMLEEHLKDKISLSVGNNQCELSKTLSSEKASKGYVRLSGEFLCSESIKKFTITFSGFFDSVPSHLHYGSIKRVESNHSGLAQEASNIIELVFNDAKRLYFVNNSTEGKTVFDIFYQYTVLGVEHILAGTDHLVFLFALLLLCRNLKQVIILVSGFTLGHSITLTFAVLGWFQPDIALIEAMIGFSIVLVVFEFLQRNGSISQSLKWLSFLVIVLLVFLKLTLGSGLPVLSLVGFVLLGVSYLLLSGNDKAPWLQFSFTVTFGFIHGFGFAQVLLSLDLPSTQLGLSLFAFNLGVEIGQLIALIVAGPLLYLVVVKSSNMIRKISMQLGMVFILVMGSYWFISRSLQFL